MKLGRVVLLVAVTVIAACEGEEQAAAPRAEPQDLQEAVLTKDGFGPLVLGRTFEAIRTTSGVELYMDACDYAINPGGFLNVVFEAQPDPSSAGERVLTGTWFFEPSEGLSPSLTPRTSAGITFGSTVDELIAKYPKATVDGTDRDVEYWVLEPSNEDNQVMVSTTAGRVTGLGTGDPMELRTPNCS